MVKYDLRCNTVKAVTPESLTEWNADLMKYMSVGRVTC